MDSARRWIVELLGGRARPLSADEPVRTEVERLLAFHGLEGLAVAEHRRSPLLPPASVAHLEPAYRRTALWTDLLVESARAARARLRAAGMDSLLFKGAALVADGTFSDPGARGMDDADLLVRRSDAERAVAVLLESGWRAWEPWRAGRSGWADSFTLTAAGSPPGMPLVLDLHWRAGYGRLRFGVGDRNGPLWEGADGEVPAPEPHLVLVAEHVLKHLRYRVHLRALADLARLARRVRDWDRVAAGTAESPLSAGIGRLLAGLAEEVGVPVPPEARPGKRGMRRGSGSLRPSSLVGRRSLAHTRWGGLLLRWRVLGSSGAVLRDLLHAAFPGTHWLRARYGDPDGASSGLRLWGRYAAQVLRWSVGRGPSPVSPNQGLEPRTGQGSPGCSGR